MNHKVHLCINGCLTLKLSLSWKTVICSSPFSVLGLVSFSPPAGEIGIVERSTGDAGFAFSLLAGATAAMVAVVRGG